MMQFEDTELEELPLDGDLVVPRIRMTTYGLPDIEIMLGDRQYEYQRSYPIKGHMATLPKAVREGLAAGKTPLVIERSERFYLYFQK